MKDLESYPPRTPRSRSSSNSLSLPFASLSKACRGTAVVAVYEKRIRKGEREHRPVDPFILQVLKSKFKHCSLAVSDAKVLMVLDLMRGQLRMRVRATGKSALVPLLNTMQEQTMKTPRRRFKRLISEAVLRQSSPTNPTVQFDFAVVSPEI